MFLFKIFSMLIFVVYIVRPTFNYIFQNRKRKVRFATNEIKYYHLSKQERKMKRKAYKEITKSVNHYSKINDLCSLMEDLKIN